MLTFFPPDIMKDDSILKDGHAVVASSNEGNSEASIAANEEHNLSFSDAIRRYPTAVFWSLFFSLGVVMAVRPQYFRSERD